ncbi:MAG: hypothetical protein RBS58_09865 [Syntrophales bacterium]|jgi:hypothetical protein|nr:hypothetical protein [Syntrophales bacterium]MDX9922932.1 hypothetical protein [Syntrophales bacterium]
MTQSIGFKGLVIMKIPSHSTREMFLRYDTVDDADARKAVNQMEGFLESVGQASEKEKGANPASEPTSCFSYGAEAGI